MSIAPSAPVMASKPMAVTRASMAYSARVDRGGANIDEGHVLAVEGRVVVGVDAEALGPERIGPGRQPLGDLRIPDDRGDLFGHEFHGGVVGRLVDGDVGEGPAHAEAAARPAVLIDPPAILRARLHG